jgi:hypothetical protein
VLLLPALVAGLALDAPPATGEWERLVAAIAPDAAAPRSLAADGFARSFVAAVTEVPSSPSPAAHDVLGTARMAQILGVLGITMLSYLVVMQSGGRARALLATLWFAVLPPIAVTGHVLRPETASVLFALLSLVLLQCLAANERPSSRTGTATMLALCLTASVATACAVATTPSAGIVLLVPGGAAMAASGQVALRMGRTLRQRSVAVWPARAAAARMWPWVLSSVASIVATILVMEGSVQAPEALLPSASIVRLLPQTPWLSWPMSALAVLGAVRLVLRTGQRLGRRGRLGADMLLLIYVAAMLLQRLLRAPLEDALPATMPLALLLADGAIYAFLLLARRAR